VPENLLFMQQGVIKGALLSSPTLEKAKDLGFKEMLNLANIKYRYPGTALVATESFIKNRPQTLDRFLKATLEGIKFAKANSDFSVKTLGKYTKTSDTKLLESAFRTYVLGYIRDMPTVGANEVETALEEIAARNPKAKGADLRIFYDPAPLDRLVREGFVRQLYPR
jgi:ABC-type nitrate/sulfonate/bicarbonate transport system substrate-binding protein